MAVFMVAGGHWAVLQGVAWTQMLWSYSKDAGSISEGLKKTFSGKYPCPLCKKVEEGRKQENKQPATTPAATKLDVVLMLADGLMALPVARKIVFFSSDEVFWRRVEAPPAPVPRCVFV